MTSYSRFGPNSPPRNPAASPDLIETTAEISALEADPDLGERTSELPGEQDHLSHKTALPSISVTGSSLYCTSARDPVVRPGKLLKNRYRIMNLVHAGGMGMVFQAIDTHIGMGDPNSLVAVKILKGELAERSELRAALRLEAASLRHLSHPNIVNVYDFDEAFGQLFLVMEWLSGETVHDMLQKADGSPIAHDLAWTIIESVARALRHAHEHGVVHADVNPSNILMDENQHVKLIDFGTCRVRIDPTAESRGSTWATLHFASPQVLTGQDATAEDDVFSLGCVAYRMVSGRHPFDGEMAVEAERLGVAPSRPSNLSDRDWRLISRALSFDRKDRPKVAEWFVRGRDIDAIVPTQPTDHDVAPADLPPSTSMLPWAAVATVAIAVLVLWAVPDGTNRESVSTPDPAAAVAGPTTSAPEPLESEESREPAAPPEVQSVIGDQMPASLAVGMQPAVAPDAAPMEEPLRAAETSPAGTVAKTTDDEREPDRQAAGSGAAIPPTVDDAPAVGAGFVAEAQAMLAAGRPDDALGLLATVRETRPDDPAIETTERAIRLLGNQRVADAEAALAAGDLARTYRLLDEAATFPSTEVSVVAALRSAADRERDTRDRIDSADALVAARQLIAPEDDNAFAVVNDLSREFPDDSRVTSAAERLGAALVTQAITAMNEGQFETADGYLGALDDLNVMQTELIAARNLLARNRVNAAAPATGAAQGPVAGRIPSGSAGSGDTVVPAPEENVAGARRSETAPAAESRPPLLPVSALDLQRYVPPRYPRRAAALNQVGFVDIGFEVLPDGSTSAVRVIRSEPEGVFDRSALNAVMNWEFATRVDVAESRIRLSFDLNE